MAVARPLRVKYYNNISKRELIAAIEKIWAASRKDKLNEIFPFDDEIIENPRTRREKPRYEKCACGK